MSDKGRVMSVPDIRALILIVVSDPVGSCSVMSLSEDVLAAIFQVYFPLSVGSFMI